MPTYKLYYFNARGRAEHCRLIFAAAGVQYEDVRFTQEQWAVEKSKAPFNQVPYMEVDGKQLAQSRVMARYLANEFGLAGTASLGKVDEAAECVLDIEQDLLAAAWSPTDSEKAMKEFVKNWPTHQGKIGKIFERNPAKGSKFLFGEKLTFADLALLVVVENVRNIPGITLTKEMEDNVKKVSEVPNVAKWLKARPQTPF